MNYVEHITKDGDRWDLLAWQYYGDPFAYEQIIVANPSVPIRPFICAGIVLRIPIIDDTATMTLNLPPWKQS